jgi:hypothetical protein
VQEKGLLDVMKWMLIENKGIMKLTLEGNKSPKPADFDTAFPCHTPDFAAQRSVPGNLPLSPWQDLPTDSPAKFGPLPYRNVMLRLI